ncbi:MAG: carbamoyl phosphate synthase small subunit [Oscillospiraceae bacterium]|jgi:carbamoyl-phosphate synthase small subunit|nr:carbamoyl phosphate synthase small subunit [Oscillospiraceae bacterium]
MTAKLILQNGRIYEGKAFGAVGTVVGEVVFTTGMTGYQETLTDPSYAGQIITQTFPLIGNYGINSLSSEAAAPAAKGYIVREHCEQPSNFRSQGDIDGFLKACGVIGLCDIDTRSLTRVIRETGVMNGMLTTEDVNIDDALVQIKSYSVGKVVPLVSVTKKEQGGKGKLNIALIDYGYKRHIKAELEKLGASVTVYPWNVSISELLADKPDGIMLSNGPGDPEENVEAIDTIREIMKQNIPLFGICLGHQLTALASGAKTFKLKYGHRGANQPVLDLATERTYVTSQNHGYAVDGDSLDKEVGEVSHVNANDLTCEGIRYKNAPAFTVQFHPEAHGGPQDTNFLFKEFISLIEKGTK